MIWGIFFQAPCTVTLNKIRSECSKCTRVIHLKAHTVVHGDTIAVIWNGWPTHLRGEKVKL